MKTFKTALITIVVNLIFLANSTLAGGFYSRDQYNFKASSDKESIISISCSKLPYKDLIFMASLTVNSRNDVLVDSVVIKSNSLKMIFDSHDSKVSEYTIDTALSNCEMGN